MMTVEHLHIHAPISHYCVQNESKLKSMIHILCSVMTRTSLGHQNKTNNVIFERVHSRLVHVRFKNAVSDLLQYIFLDKTKIIIMDLPTNIKLACNKKM